MTHHLIIGAGVFGLSTAYHLLLSGETHVTVIDKADTLPAPDGSSNDINRIVRTAYGDPLYTNLVRESIEGWKRDFPGIYHESGVLILGSSGYALDAEKNDIAAGVQVTSLPDLPAAQAVFPAGITIGDLDATSGYLNSSSGWADAHGGIKALLDKVLELGGAVLPGKTVRSLIFGSSGEATGVLLGSDETITADVIVVATGSWTPSTFHNECPDLSTRLTATGQSIASVQLDSAEAVCYKDIPVILNFNTGFYVFPPNRDGLLKCAIHDGGYLHIPDNASAPISTPRTLLSHGEEGLAIPTVMAEKLRSGLRAAYPELADRPFCKTRLCWYADTEDGDWIIDQHPDHSNLYIATGGSGHAYKFLPVLGRLVMKRIKGTLPADAAAKFSFTRSFAPHVDPDRIGRQTQILPTELTRH